MTLPVSMLVTAPCHPQHTAQGSWPLACPLFLALLLYKSTLWLTLSPLCHEGPFLPPYFPAACSTVTSSKLISDQAPVPTRHCQAASLTFLYSCPGLRVSTSPYGPESPPCSLPCVLREGGGNASPVSACPVPGSGWHQERYSTGACKPERSPGLHLTCPHRRPGKPPPAQALEPAPPYTSPCLFPENPEERPILMRLL